MYKTSSQENVIVIHPYETMFGHDKRQHDKKTINWGEDKMALREKQREKCSFTVRKRDYVT